MNIMAPVKMRLKIALLATGMTLLGGWARGEVVLQFFNNSWNEITEKIPEIAEVGYSSLWLPPPQKASGDLSVGYDLWDPFDLGSNAQRGGRTRYGNEDDLLRLIETAHRFGLRVYFDNIMNHRAFDIPGYNEFTPIDIYPGMLPEDFHLRVTEDGFYRAWDDTKNWGNTWEVQNQFLSGLIDIAHESPNSNFGPTLGSQHPKIEFVRHPNQPEFYDFHPTLGHVGFYNTNITVQVISNNPAFYQEDVGGYMMRSVRWLMDRTKADGLRLDAVKHVPAYFFGDQWSSGKDTNSAGYCGQAQWQFNQSRGFSDPNHRDTVFDTEQARDDAMMFGEHMGEPPPYGDYFAAGMRLVDAKIHQTLNDVLGNPSRGLWGLENDGYVENFQFGAYNGVPYAKSHDDAVAYREELHNAINLTRRGLPNIYTDGNRQAETLGESGGAFPRHANTRPFGQFGDSRIPNLVYIHNQFARGSQAGRATDADVLAYERRDKRENGAMSDADATTLLMLINDDYSSGAYREIATTFPDGAWLWQYSTAGAGFYTRVTNGQVRVITPPGGYFAFSWRNPEASALWQAAGGRPLQIYENGREPGWVSYVRKEGPDGDAAFNPYGVYDSNTTDFAYTYYVPRVNSATNLRFVARVDGSAYNVMMKLDGGVPLNAASHSLGDPRDGPPALTSDVYLGYEQADFKHRQHREKFAARDTALHNVIGSAGAESYTFVVGQAGWTINDGTTGTDSDVETAEFVYHDPEATTDHGFAQFWPPPETAADGDIHVWTKTGFENQINKVFLYYTTDGQSWPEGAGGEGFGSTQVKELTWSFKTNSMDWWTTATPIPGLPAGTVFRYKIGAFRQQDGSSNANWIVRFPNSAYDIEQKTSMMGVWQMENLDLAQTVYRPHNDYGLSSTGLVEGFHTVSARAFLERPDRAAIYNTFQQTFYLDAQPPQGEIFYPGENDYLYDNRYGAVVRTDPTVTEVWYNIEDVAALNDDGQTGQGMGNGTNALGVTSWVKATRVTPTLGLPSSHPLEWRFTYNNIASNGTALIRVKLAELSSSTNPLMDDVNGHFTTLTRTVNARGPDLAMSIGWPQNDGDTVGAGYQMKVYFSPAMWTPDEATTRSRFLITLDGVAQNRDNYQLSWQAGPNGQHELSYVLPDLYNGDPNYLHEIAVEHTNAMGGGVTLFASRIVKAAKSTAQASVVILDPPELNLDGAPYQIVLPDVALPSPTQRQYAIRVQTDTSVKQVWIDFTNSSGTAVAMAASTNELTGTLSVAAGDVNVVGSNTLFDSQVTAGSLLRLGSNIVIVSSVDSATNLVLREAFPGASATNISGYLVTGNPLSAGSKLYWTFLWTNILSPGSYTLVAKADTNNQPATVEAQAVRSTRVIFRDRVTEDTDFDDDDDGLMDAVELATTNLPSSNSETWNNGQVHIWYVYGKTDPQLPDSDGDGLPDGLESGWRSADPGNTQTNVDTNGDGFPNFRGDRDPPFFNTVPDNWDVPNYNFNDGRTKLIAGSMTDPLNPDSDGDGLPDGREDGNRNGWVDGDGMALGPEDPKSVRVNAGDWPDGIRQNWETWSETDPGNSDSDGDGLSDGYGEDVNLNGAVDGDSNSNRVWNAGELWQESDPLNPDTDGDGLPDGWEVRYGLDPWDNGVIGATNLRTGALISGALHGASGNPDGDFIVVGLVTNDYSNLLEYQNSTHPFIPDNGEPLPEGSITIGRGPALGVVAGVTNYEEFMDWTADDLLALDAYEGDGSNSEGGDVYPSWVLQGSTWVLDGFDTSRDIVAFYARDGGNADGRFYFRADFHDLQAYAEDSALDLYVVIDTGQPTAGEVNLPDEVNLTTDMKWEAVVACYKSGQGAVYVDTVRNNNTTASGQAVDGSVGVERRDQSTTAGFVDAYFNSELDAVEFAISRQALLDAGWNGLNAASLNYQVFVTKDGTCDSCGTAGASGPGDIGGRNDVRDTILDDYLAEDKADQQQGIQHILRSWIPGTSKPNLAKLAMLLHGNQAIQPGNVVQELLINSAGGGYYRPLDGHQLYGLPLNLHITPTLASAMEWAKADPAGPAPWLDGPTFNDWIETLIHTNLVSLLASTFSDHMLPYFTADSIRDNEALAREALQTIYHTTLTTDHVFWAPERLLDHDVFGKIASLGYRATVLDQMEHLLTWYGRTDALGTRGYQMNRVSGITTFAIQNGASDFRFQNYDRGLNLPLRRLFSRKARSGEGDQLVTLFSNWEDFAAKASADAYDVNLRWIANTPWVRMVTLKDVLNGQVDLNGDGSGDSWFVQERGNLVGQDKLSHNYINYATQGNYDQWYLGSDQEEGLLGKHFEIRPGVALPLDYGMLYSGGAVSQSWSRVSLMGDTNLAKLGRAAFHASLFQSAFHSQPSTDLTKFSDGRYINPDATSNTLASFVRPAQAQTRMAAIQRRVDQWAAAAAGITTPQAVAEDVDLDGEVEYILCNDRLFGLFERIGGRLVGAWSRDILSGRVFQGLGNHVSYAGSDTEYEGFYNADTNGAVGAYRTSGLKDWYVDGISYVNDLYSFASAGSGWTATTSDGKLQKTVTLAAKAWSFEVAYQLSDSLAGKTLYIRNGLSPNLWDLLLRGQTTLGAEIHQGGVLTLANTNYGHTVAAVIGYADAGHSAAHNAAAEDDNPLPGRQFATYNMRNQAQTHQVEIYGTGSFTFSLGLQAGGSDWDGDGLPNEFEDNSGLDSGDGADGQSDDDLDGFKAWQEYVAGTAANNGGDYPRLTSTARTNASGVSVRFPTVAQREYAVWYANQGLLSPTWQLATTNPVAGTGGVVEWIDDGLSTSPHPDATTNRFYRIEVGLPR